LGICELHGLLHSGPYHAESKTSQAERRKDDQDRKPEDEQCLVILSFHWSVSGSTGGVAQCGIREIRLTCSFPLNRRRGLGTNIVDHSVDALHFIDDTV